MCMTLISYTAGRAGAGGTGLGCGWSRRPSSLLFGLQSSPPPLPPQTLALPRPLPFALPRGGPSVRVLLPVARSYPSWATGGVSPHETMSDTLPPMSS